MLQGSSPGPPCPRPGQDTCGAASLLRVVLRRGIKPVRRPYVLGLLPLTWHTAQLAEESAAREVVPETACASSLQLWALQEPRVHAASKFGQVGLVSLPRLPELLRCRRQWQGATAVELWEAERLPPVPGPHLSCRAPWLHPSAFTALTSQAMQLRCSACWKQPLIAIAPRRRMRKGGCPCTSRHSMATRHYQAVPA